MTQYWVNQYVKSGQSHLFCHLKRILFHGHFCYLYNVAQYRQCHIPAEAAHYSRRKTYLGVHVFKIVQC